MALQTQTAAVEALLERGERRSSIEASALGELLPAEEPGPEEEVSLSLSHQAVREAVEALPQREREVIKLRYGMTEQRRPASQRAIARKLGTSSERVRQLEAKALEHLAAVA